MTCATDIFKSYYRLIIISFLKFVEHCMLLIVITTSTNLSQL